MTATKNATTDDQPPAPFWSASMIALVAINIVFLIIILVGLVFVATALFPPLAALLKDMLN